ncbi:MarR family transcriptional regulator [Amycolatopsis sp. MJM2582]|uniref:MarR family transcriptional regulator n=1 Tax=Amycolatopsis japonica TaxID=208439 RepID=A0A075ULA9_9PSEU|nr:MULTISPECIES: MarR family transcriptional regulator [Amycolatopsis]AIG73369.1 MarR family transcriptional regulator [Amycolatopsis japonica]KFZ84236.1 MarR family transcriptional regulator [Amycolatopsis sp. MJM2582]OKJ99019.1 MarR family transcriptional regulator [Amycolatopsis sp. CB00013]RSN48177.1 MarR family transcriptional regulator [Amycolatopsis sp. WAC 04197]
MTTSTVQDVSGRLFLAVGRLSRSLRQAGVPGPGHGAISALATLVHHGQLRLGDLAAKEGVAAATMSRIVASLVEAGYVSRESDPIDRRAWLAEATEEGERLVSGVRSTRVNELGKRLERLTPEHQAALAAALPALEALIADEER